MRGEYALSYREGHLCVSFTTTSTFEPIRIVHHWPLVRMGEVRARDRFPVGEPVRLGDTLAGAARVWTEEGRELPTLRTVHSVCVEREDVPPPRTRCPVRWEMGRWEKRLARRGWVPV